MNGSFLVKKNFAVIDRKFTLIQVEFLSRINSDLVKI